MVGALFELDEATRVGVTYLASVDLDFEDAVSIDGVGPLLRRVFEARALAGSTVDIGLTLPQSVMFSAYRKFGDRLALMGNSAGSSGASSARSISASTRRTRPASRPTPNTTIPGTRRSAPTSG